MQQRRKINESLIKSHNFALYFTLILDFKTKLTVGEIKKKIATQKQSWKIKIFNFTNCINTPKSDHQRIPLSVSRHFVLIIVIIKEFIPSIIL